MLKRKKTSSVWRELESEKCNWINITSPDKAEVQRLGRRFPLFETLDLLEALPPLQRPKVVDRNNYLFLVLLFPVYNRETKQIEPHEIDFFITNETLVTIHDSSLLPVNDVFDSCAATAESKHLCLSGTPMTLLIEVLRALLASQSPMLVHIGHDIDEVEKNIFDARRKGTILEILRIKTNIASYRKAIGGHKNIIQHMVHMAEHRFPSDKLHLFMEHLIDQTVEFWDLLDTYKDTIDAIHSSHQTIIEARLNDVMRVLTMISVIIFPLNFIAAFFAMPSSRMPIIHSPNGVWIVSGLMALVTGVLVYYFVKKKWV